MGVNCIIMNAADKAVVESERLRPVERQGGAFIVNALVLESPDFAAAHSYLSGLPLKDSSDPTFPPSLDESE